MGYTHYWRRPEQIDQEIFKKAVEDCKKVCQSIPVRIVKEWDNSKPPIFNSKQIWFNGVGEDGHETFSISALFKKPDWQSNFPENKEYVFDFCKTAHKPYDLNVTSCLIIFKHYFDNKFIVSSDGDSLDWDEARKVCQKVLGYGQNFQLDKEE